MKWLQFILSHSLFIAFCAVALCWQTALLLQQQLSLSFYSFIFFSTICSYNFYWLLSKYSFSTQNIKQFLGQNYSNSLFFLAAGAGTLICMLQLAPLLPVIFSAAILTFLYAVPLLPFAIVKPARKAGLLKTILLAFTWAFITVYMPYVQTGLHSTNQLLPLLANRFLFMLMLCIIFDERDTAIDKIRGLHSLTTIIPAKAVQVLMAVVFTAYILLLFYSSNFYSAAQTTALLLAGIAALTAYYFSLRKQNYFFYYFLVDGLMLFSAVLTYLVSI